MGCHTWFYKKIDPQPTYDEVKAVVMNNMKENAKLYQKMIDDTLDEDIKEDYPEWNKEMGEKYLPIMLRKIRMIEKDLCKKAQYNRYRYNDDLTVFINGVFYVYTDDLPHDLFRIGGYPKDKLFSLNQTMEFIERNKQKMSFSDDWEYNLKKFWLEYPDGMVEFG